MDTCLPSTPPLACYTYTRNIPLNPPVETGTDPMISEMEMTGPGLSGGIEGGECVIVDPFP
jgi:hypothetical protein